MSTYSWKNPVSGDWSNASLWSPAGGPPDDAGAAAVIAAQGAYTVSLDAGSTETVGSLTLADAEASVVVHSTGILAFAPAGTLTLDTGHLRVYGTIKDAVISATAGDRLSMLGGTLDGVTIHGPLDLVSAPYAAVVVTNGLTLTGPSGVGPGLLTLGDGVSLTAIGPITFDNATIVTQQGLRAVGAVPYTSANLTLGAHFTLQGAGDLSGTVVTNDGTMLSAALNGAGGVDVFYTFGSSFINDGSIVSTVPGGGFDSESYSMVNNGIIDVSNGGYADLSYFTNTGTITVTDGSLGLEDPTSDDRADIGSITATGSDVVLDGFTAATLGWLHLSDDDITFGSLNNTGATLDVGTGTKLGLLTIGLEGTIELGTIINVGGPTSVSDAAALFGVTYDGTLDLEVAPGSENVVFSIEHGITFAGVSGHGAASVAVDTNVELDVEGPTHLDNVTITLATATEYNSFGLVGAELALGTGVVVQDGLEDFRGTTEITSSSYTGGASYLINSGTIIARNAGGSLLIDASSFTNNGMLIARNGDTMSVTGSTNIVGTTLSGGTYDVEASSRLAFLNYSVSQPITTLSASVTLAGAGSELVTQTGPYYELTTIELESTLSSIGTAGTLSLLGGRGYSTTLAMTDYGHLVLNGGTFAAKSLAVGQFGTILGTGTSIAPIVNNGVLDASGGTLTLAGPVSGSGALRADADSVLRVNEAPMTTITNRLSLIGGGSDIAFGTATFTPLEASLTVIAAGATFSVLGGRGYVTDNTLTDSGVFNLGGGGFTLGGLIVTAGGTVSGSGTISHAVDNAGTMDARGSLLKLGTVTGAGSLKIENASTLELTAASQAVTFAAGGVATLALDAPAGLSGHIGGLALGDRIDFTSETVTSATIAGTTLTVVGSAGTEHYQVAGALAGNHFAIQPDHHTIALVSGAALALAPPAFLPLSAAAEAPALAMTMVMAAPPSLNIPSGSVSPEPTPTAGTGWLYQSQPTPTLLVGHN